MACKYGDLICPCQDGDPCHYEPHGDTPAMNVPPDCVLRAIAAERWTCAEIAQQHGEFCHKEAQNGGHPSLHERGNGATYIAGKIRERARA